MLEELLDELLEGRNIFTSESADHRPVQIRKEDKEEGGDPMDDEDMDDSDEEVEKDHEWAKDAMVSNGVGAALDFMRSRGSLKVIIPLDLAAPLLLRCL